MENYCRGDHLMNTAKIMFCITILLTAPIECFVARNLVINTLFRWKKIDSIPSHEEDRLPKVTVTFFLVAATCLISFSTDCLSIVLEFNVSSFDFKFPKCCKYNDNFFSFHREYSQPFL